VLPVPVHLVLIAPQDLVNVASAVRICRNFGLASMRVVQPEVELDPWRIEGIAHNTAEFVSRIVLHDRLADALADCVHAQVLTGRERAAKRRVLRPREAAPELLAHGALGPVALVAGREDSGLTNDELDACQTLVTIATDPSYTSLNLAQAIAVMAYELRVAAGGDRQPVKLPRRRSRPASMAEHELLFADWRRALWALEFFKTRQEATVLRGLRELLFRAGLDQRELKLLRAMELETVRFLERRGLDPARPPGEVADDLGRPPKGEPSGEPGVDEQGVVEEP
jgi:tRNA (cytidine32/uridine32-2'-O)-methyltransferase